MSLHELRNAMQKDNSIAPTECQLAFINAVQGNEIKYVNSYFTINDAFHIRPDGEFDNIDTHAAFLIFKSGYEAAQKTKSEIE